MLQQAEDEHVTPVAAAEEHVQNETAPKKVQADSTASKAQGVQLKRKNKPEGRTDPGI